ncbi:unnamed protein product [Lathyrus sativus]|nr:unnamed protein product [Lathyrus sativus]
MFVDQLSCSLGSGKDMAFWHNKWALNYSLKEVFPNLYIHSENSRISVVKMGCWIDSEWDWIFNYPIFPAGSVMEWELEDFRDLILKVSPNYDGEYTFNWDPTDTHLFSVSYCYEVIFQNRIDFKVISVMIEGFTAVWASKIPSNLQVFLWRMFRNCEATKDQWVRRRIDIGGESLDYRLCGKAVESIQHVFITCDFSVKV